MSREMQQRLRHDLLLTPRHDTNVYYLQSRFRELCYRFADRLHRSITTIPLLRKFAKQNRSKSAPTIWHSPLSAQGQRTDQHLRPEGDEDGNVHAVPGVNVIGFLQSEKGVGEAARATLRSLTAAEIP